MIFTYNDGASAAVLLAVLEDLEGVGVDGPRQDEDAHVFHASLDPAPKIVGRNCMGSYKTPCIY